MGMMADASLFLDVSDPIQVPKGALTPFVLLTREEIDFIPPDLALSIGEVSSALSSHAPLKKTREQKVDEVVHVKSWRLGGSGETPLVDDIVGMKKGGVTGMLNRQRDLLTQMSIDACIPMHQIKPIPTNAVLFSLVQRADEVGEPVLENWANIAGRFEEVLPRIMVDRGLVSHDDIRDGGDYRVWTHLIEEMGLKETEVAQGFSAKMAEAFVKNVVSFTAEHLEHIDSTAVNYFPLQHQGTTMSADIVINIILCNHVY